ncbi:MAG TPA: EamA family transporter [Candidatus Binatia bacterium]|jgi:drug/metabolite transporter (DMT)-like permease
MIFLFLAILGSALIPVLFRGFSDWHINLFWAIPLNYLTCVFVGSIWGAHLLDVTSLPRQPWLWLAVLQGVILAVNFFLLAYTAQRAGVSIAALASRLSVAIPSILAFLLYGDSLSLVKLAGLGAAVLSLYLCTMAHDRKASLRLFPGTFLPLLVFFTFGCYFFVIKYAQAHYLNEASYHDYVMTGFLFAFLTALGICIGRRLLILTQVGWLDLVGGTLLGIVNYFAVYALVKALAVQGWETSQVLPIYSIGVIALSSILALLIFRETLSRQKTFGLAVGLVAVILLNR